MNHIIDGYQVDLRTRSVEQLERMALAASDRCERAAEEFDSLKGEIVRRANRPLQAVS